MYIVESLLLTVMLFTCIFASYSDIKNGIVSNKLLLVSGLVCIVINIIYYAFFARDWVYLFSIDFLLLSIISVLMYAFNLWAAGDSKLLFVIVLAIPSRYYYTEAPIGAAPAVFILVFTFSIAFIYIIFESAIMFFRNKQKIVFNLNVKSIIDFIKKYICCSIYIVSTNYFLLLLFPEFISKNASLVTMLSLFLSIIIYKYDFFFKKIPIVIASMVSAIVITIYFVKYGWHTPNMTIYAYLAVIVFLRTLAEKYNYKTISTSDVKPGMILATSSVALMSPSRIKGLPKNTTEDMRSRLTANEVESIHRWEHSKYGMKSVIIVRKIPFAIFMSIGTIIFILFRLGVI